MRHRLSKLTLILALAAALPALHAASSTAVASPATTTITNTSTATIPPLDGTNTAPDDATDTHHGFTFKIGDDDGDKADSSSPPHTKVSWQNDVLDDLIPICGMIGVFGLPVMIVFLYSYFRFRRRQMTLRLIRDYLEKGVPVPPELLRGGALSDDQGVTGLRTPADQGRRDRRRGVILLFVGLAIALGMYIDDPSHHDWGWGLVPAVIGLGYLIIGVLEQRSDRPEPPSSRIP